MDCLFCKIIDKSISANIIYQNDNVIAFNDINPKSPVHVLIIPKIHISTLNDLNEEHKSLMGELVFTAKFLAEDLGIAEAGYRLNFNCNPAGGQTVYHIHLHLLQSFEVVVLHKWLPLNSFHTPYFFTSTKCSSIALIHHTFHSGCWI